VPHLDGKIFSGALHSKYVT